MNVSLLRPSRIAAVLGAAIILASGCRRADPGSSPAPSDGEETAAPSDRAISDFGDRKVDRAEELLAGRFAGVDVFRLPSGAISVRIRGGSSVLGSNEPLFVLDGMPLNAGPGGALNGINPEDIERIEVLKDIGSTAQYGVRGANGVVLITTRRPPRNDAGAPS